MSLLSITELSNGEFIGLSVIEITTVPHLSILQKRFSQITNIDTEYKHDMDRLLSEVHQNYRNAHDSYHDISLELLWTTQSVNNQTFKAKINLHLIVRAIGHTKEEIQNTINSLMIICKKTLTYGKYDFEELDYKDLSVRVKNINNQAVKAIIKTESLEMLNDANLPYCFSFEKLPETENDLSRIVNSLIEYPDCAVSFQLIPTTYSPDETMSIDRNTHMLENIAKGVMTPGMGSISNPLAEKHAGTYKYYSVNKNSSAFYFNILVYGNNNSTNSISTRILAHLNNKNELRVISLGADDVKKDDNFFPLPWAVKELLLSY